MLNGPMRTQGFDNQSYLKASKPIKLECMKFQQTLSTAPMSTGSKLKKNTKIISETTDIYLQQGQLPLKNRYSFNYAPLRTRNNYDTLKTINRKSIEINANKNSTIQHQQRTFSKRAQVSFLKQTHNRRYEESDIRSMNKSPYIKRELQARTTSLNRSANKIKSSNSIYKNSAIQDMYKPSSSLSQHYDPSESNSHKRRVSLVNNDRNYILQEAKECYKYSDFHKSIELLKKYVKFNKESTQARYFLGMSYVNNNQFSLGVEELLEALALDPMFKKSLYLVIALGFKKIGKINEAVEILSKGLTYFPDYYDCLVYRGKMYLKGQNYENSIKDFARAIQLNPKKGFAYLGKGTAEKELGQIDEAIKTLTSGLKSDMQQSCLQKRGIIYFDLKNYEKAIQNFQQCKQGTSTSGGSFNYIKGITYYRLKKPMQAMLSFEQSIKQDTNQQNVTCSVQMMMKIKIEDKDFYEAYHILSRTNNIEINKEIIDEWRLFLQGTLFMMKKKYKEGISTIKSLLSLPLYTTPYEQILTKKSKERYQFLKPLAHLYKAFGQLSEINVLAAKQDYRQYDIICSKSGNTFENLSKTYNCLIMQAEQCFPQDCFHLLSQASLLIPNKPQPHLFLAFQKVQNHLRQDLAQKQQNMQYVIDSISTSISHLPQLSNNHISNFYYYRSIIYLYKGEFNKAVADVDKAIEKSQDNIPKYFYLRGLAFAIFGNFAQSVQDLSVAISLDQKYANAYLERAKCLQIEGNSNEAFLDLQKYITLSPEDPFIHKYAGFLLFQNCAYEDCLAAFSHGNEDMIDHEMLLTKAKCHFLLNNTKQCIKLFEQYHQESSSQDFASDVELIKITSTQITQQTSEAQYKEKLKIIQQMIETVTSQSEEYMHQIKASIYLFLGQYENSLAEFDKTLHYFRIQKKQELEKQFVEDTQQFQDEWSQVEIQFNIALGFIALSNYKKAEEILQQFEKSSERGKNWEQFTSLLRKLRNGEIRANDKIVIDTFEQNHRISKNWPRLKIPNFQISLSLAFSYPFVEPPEMLPEFDHSLFAQFHMNKVQKKPEAPWINRHEKGLIFTPHIQVFENLQLSVTTKKHEDNESEVNKQISQIDRSVELSSSQFHLQTEALKQKFKLDSLVEMKLKKLMNKKESNK